MPTILHIDSSPRIKQSFSRQLGKEFIDLWKSNHPGDKIVYRDLGRKPIPYASETWVDASHSPALTAVQKRALKLSDELVDELLAADRFVFAIPVYDLTVPATFKSYIEQIVRFGRTIAPDLKGDLKGLVTGKKLLVISARGSEIVPGSPAAAADHFESYLRHVFGFIGVTDAKFVHAHGLGNEAAQAKALERARAALKEIASSW
jgi:FMN-dependent NADH-azoreductase